MTLQRTSIRRLFAVGVGLLLVGAAVVPSEAGAEPAAPTLSPFGRTAAQVSYDRAVTQAMLTADRLTRERLKKDPNAAPVRPVLPAVRAVTTATSLGTRQPLQLPAARTAVAARPAGRAGATALQTAPCTGDTCYQSDHAMATGNLPAGTYAFDYWMWLGIPQGNETNGCDGGGDGSCFWFQAAQYNTDAAGGGFHVGPQRGASLAGNAGANWYLSHSGYNDGVFTGSLCRTINGFCVNNLSIPTATWVRIRVWRLATNYDPNLGFVSKWGSWAMWNGVDHQIGTNLWIKGTTLTWASLFTEIYESNGPCQTDFERTYFNDPRSLAGSTWSAPSPAHVSASYQRSCSLTTWESLGGTFIRNEREVPRLVSQGSWLW